MSESQVAANLKDVLRRVDAAVQKSNSKKQARLVAIGKTKPVEMVQELYEAGHRDFGENYVQELLDKAPKLPKDTKWHFVGHLQSNKAKMLVEGVPSLAVIETVDSEKLANKLENALEGQSRPPLDVYVQVNTSGEDSKSGVEPSDVVSLAKHIKENCPHLRFSGLMTIGMQDYTSRPENFKCLSVCRAKVCEAIGMDPDDVEMSMGMSGDFEQAIEMGSTNVRVGSTIFGERHYPNKEEASKHDNA
ncbi:hypothetical protein WJX84_002490 [Apatococcus fuscideae]|uniref:Pyridoxal phosphate homeostasis protein n=1 Tax=Apatococcus fuscideae TaxID=2026836 RepID=A0AAW1SIK3_9CHLO